MSDPNYIGYAAYLFGCIGFAVGLHLFLDRKGVLKHG